MRQIEIAPTAAREIADIIDHSNRRFGAEAARRYRALIGAAVRGLSAESSRAGVRPLDDDTDPRRLFHLRHARALLPAADRIVNPRHFILFRETMEKLIVLRVLHDAMDIPRRAGDSALS